MTGTVTMNSNTGSASFTLRADSATEGAETMTFACQGLTRSVTVNDTSTTPLIERAQLEGTTSVPKMDGIPVSNGYIRLGFKFRTTGRIRAFESVANTDSFSGYAPWCTSDIYVDETTFGATNKSPSTHNWYVMGSLMDLTTKARGMDQLRVNTLLFHQIENMP